MNIKVSLLFLTILLVLLASYELPAKDVLLTGRVVDRGSECASLVVVVDLARSKKCDDCWEHFSEFTITDELGRFSISLGEVKSGDVAKLWTVCSEVKDIKDFVVPVYPPFNIELRTPNRYKGFEIQLGKKNKIDLGEQNVQLRYKRVTLTFIGASSVTFLKEKTLWLKLFDAKGNLFSEPSLPTQAFNLANNSVSFLLPDDKWRIQLLAEKGGKLLSEEIKLDLVKSRFEERTISITN